MNVLFKIKLIAFLSVASAAITTLASTWNFLKCHNAQEFIWQENTTMTIKTTTINNNGSLQSLPTLELNVLRSMARGSALVGLIASVQIIVSSCLIAASKSDVAIRWKFWTAFTITTQIICLVCLIAPATIYKKLVSQSDKTNYAFVFPLLKMYYQGLGSYSAAHILLLVSAILVMRIPNDFNYKSVILT